MSTRVMLSSRSHCGNSAALDEGWMSKDDAVKDEEGVAGWNA